MADLPTHDVANDPTDVEDSVEIEMEAEVLVEKKQDLAISI